MRIDQGLLGRLQDDGVPGGEGGSQLPDRHEDREVPRDDLPDDPEWLVEVIGDGVGIDLRDATLLCPDRPREVAEVVDGQGQVRSHRLADRLAIVPGLGQGEVGEVGGHALGDGVENDGPLGG